MRTTSTKPEPFVTVEELARILGVRTSWVYMKASDGVIPHLRAGRYLRFRVSEVLDALTVEAEKELAEDG